MVQSGHIKWAKNIMFYVLEMSSLIPSETQSTDLQPWRIKSLVSQVLYQAHLKIRINVILNIYSSVYFYKDFFMEFSFT